jgi:hypothetical protein
MRKILFFFVGTISTITNIHLGKLVDEIPLVGYSWVIIIRIWPGSNELQRQRGKNLQRHE